MSIHHSIQSASEDSDHSRSTWIEILEGSSRRAARYTASSSFPEPQAPPAVRKGAGEFLTLDARETRKIFEEDFLPAFDHFEEQLRRLSAGTWTLGGGRRLFTTSYAMHTVCLLLRTQLRTIFLPADELPAEPIKPEKSVYERLQSIGVGIGTLLRSLNEFIFAGPGLDQEALLVLRRQILRNSLRLKGSSFNSAQEKTQLLIVLQALSSSFLDTATSLAPFNNFDVPCIQSQQKHIVGTCTRMQTMMIFFSGVTITGIQFTFQNNGTGAEIVANFFWFGSLALSICTILFLQQSVFQHQDTKRFDSSPSQDPYGRSLVWLPRLLAVGSIVFFAVGFVIFCWSSSQHRAVFVFVAIVVLGALLFMTFTGIRVEELIESEGLKRAEIEEKEKARLEREIEEILSADVA